MPDAEAPRHRILTPPGRSALAIVLVEGCAHLPSVLRSAAGLARAWPREREVVHAQLVDGEHVVDDLVARGTTEGVELHVHGGEAVVASVCASLVVAGSRPAPRPATCAGPVGLRHARALASLRWGTLARLADEARLAVVRGWLSPRLRRRLEPVRARSVLARHLETPPVVRLVGRPNAGKSTLFNALLSDDRALVSAHEGTTRDTVSALLVLAGAPVRLEDTAGVSHGAHDREGVDLLVHLLDRGEEAPRRDVSAVPVLCVRGKADLMPVTDDAARPAVHDGQDVATRGAAIDADVLAVSGHTRLGLDVLLSRIALALELDGDAHDDVLAPVDAALRRLLDAALALPDDPAPRA